MIIRTLLEKMMKILDILISSWEILNPLKIEIKFMYKTERKKGNKDGNLHTRS